MGCNIIGFAQDCSISSALAMEILQSCIKASILSSFIRDNHVLLTFGVICHSLISSFKVMNPHTKIILAVSHRIFKTINFSKTSHRWLRRKPCQNPPVHRQIYLPRGCWVMGYLEPCKVFMVVSILFYFTLFWWQEQIHKTVLVYKVHSHIDLWHKTVTCKQNWVTHIYLHWGKKWNSGNWPMFWTAL